MGKYIYSNGFIYEGEFKTPIDTVVKDFENGLYNLKVIITLVSIAMAVILVLLVGTLLSGKVIERQKVIGIFKSLASLALVISSIRCLSNSSRIACISFTRLS